MKYINGSCMTISIFEKCLSLKPRENTRHFQDFSFIVSPFSNYSLKSGVSQGLVLNVFSFFKPIHLG